MDNLELIRLKSCAISISIVTYKNEISKVADVLESLSNTLIYTKTIIIDNSPTDEIRSLCNIFPDTDYFHNPSNPGFGSAHNLALSKLGSSDYHLVLNPDVYFKSDVIPELIQYLHEHLDVGLIQPKVYSPNGDIQYLCKRYPTFFALFARRFIPTPFHFILKKYLDWFEMQDIGYEQVFEPQYLSGCFMLFRRSCFDEIGGFDEKIFLHMEDADITYRMSRKYKTVFYPHVHIFHHWARGSHKSISQTINTIQSAFYFFNKHGWKLI
jgi:GT2 family glycosyltransferase